jgi:hypothetical protein
MPSRIYGMICPECRKPFPLGDVRLPLSSNLVDLHHALIKQELEPEFRFCPNPRCKALVYTTIEKLIFLDSAASPQT